MQYETSSWIFALKFRPVSRKTFINSFSKVPKCLKSFSAPIPSAGQFGLLRGGGVKHAFSGHQLSETIALLITGQQQPFISIINSRVAHPRPHLFGLSPINQTKVSIPSISIQCARNESMNWCSRPEPGYIVNKLLHTHGRVYCAYRRSMVTALVQPLTSDDVK